MTYNSLETSSCSGNPVELYEFAKGTAFWYYTGADQDVVHDGKTFVRNPLTRSVLDEVSELNRTNLKITVSRTNPVADLFRVHPPGVIVTVKVWRKHRDDAEAVLVWFGRILNCEWLNGEAELHTEPVYTSVRRNGLRRFYQRQCPHILYGPACRLNAAAFRVAGSVVSVVGNRIQVAAAGSRPDGWFAGGYLTWVTPLGETDTRMIREHTGSTIVVVSAPYRLGLGATVSLYPGCDHTLATCRTKFDNRDNFGGFPYVPGKNPFNLTTLY